MDLPSPEPIDIIVNKLKVGFIATLSKEYLFCAKNSNVFLEDKGKYFAFKFLSYLAAMDKALIKFPEDWWQAFRERWFPRWWLKRYPVRYREEKQYITCPHLNIPDNDPHLRFLMQGIPNIPWSEPSREL